MSRILALDVGEERIGLAISDELARLARPFEVVIRVPGSASFEHIRDVVLSQGIGLMVIGWPLLEGGAEGAQVRSTAAYLRGLEKYIAIPIVRWDERSSTNEANTTMSRDGTSRRRVRRKRDAVAAAIILQRYLDETSQGVTW
jgi:putative holliday junction resolvase